jgi:hypothetical protein
MSSHVINPNTGRLIEVGGPTWRRLNLRPQYKEFWDEETGEYVMYVLKPQTNRYIRSQIYNREEKM